MKEIDETIAKVVQASAALATVVAELEQVRRKMTATPPFDANLAPNGYKAVPEPRGFCLGCAFVGRGVCNTLPPCTGAGRLDRQSVIFVKKE